MVVFKLLLWNTDFCTNLSLPAPLPASPACTILVFMDVIWDLGYQFSEHVTYYDFLLHIMFAFHNFQKMLKNLSYINDSKAYLSVILYHNLLIWGFLICI